MKQSTADGVANKTKKEERSDITEEDERTMWNKGLLGCNTAKCLLRTIYFYNGKLFGLRSKGHRDLRYSNFRVEGDCPRANGAKRRSGRKPGARVTNFVLAEFKVVARDR